MATNDKAERTPTQRGPLAAYLAGKDSALGLPRWGFYLLIIIAVVVGDEVEKLLVSRYSLPESKAFLLSFVPVILFGLLVGVVIRRLSRREIP